MIHQSKYQESLVFQVTHLYLQTLSNFYSNFIDLTKIVLRVKLINLKLIHPCILLLMSLYLALVHIQIYLMIDHHILSFHVLFIFQIISFQDPSYQLSIIHPLLSHLLCIAFLLLLASFFLFLVSQPLLTPYSLIQFIGF